MSSFSLPVAYDFLYETKKNLKISVYLSKIPNHDSQGVMIGNQSNQMLCDRLPGELINLQYLE